MSTDFTGKTIYIVDDSSIAIGNLKKTVEELGLKVVGTATSGLECLEFTKSHQPDFISLDIIMPEMDGIELYRSLRNAGISSKVFFVSSLSAEPRVIEAYVDEIGSECFLRKPATIEALQSILPALQPLNGKTTSNELGQNQDAPPAFQQP